MTELDKVIFENKKFYEQNTRLISWLYATSVIAVVSLIGFLFMIFSKGRCLG